MKQSFEHYYKYMQEITPKLIEAENTIHEIKSSKAWRKASNYFKVLYHRGFLLENPCRKNNYAIKPCGKVVQISDIEDILTPEQLEQVIKKALKGN